MTDPVLSNATSNQGTITYNSAQLEIREWRTTRVTFQNNTGDVLSVSKGTVLGIENVGGNTVLFDASATDGSQIPQYLLADEITDLANGGTATVVVYYGGVFRRDQVIFTAVGDDFDTICTAEDAATKYTVERWFQINGSFEFPTVTNSSIAES